MDAAPLRPQLEARCRTHSDQGALGACARCGSFYCALDSQNIEGKDYCATCASHPDVDYLEAFRRKYWGRRDVWAWLFGLGAIFNLVMGVVLLVGSEGGLNSLTLVLLAGGTVGLCYWWGLPPARFLLCLVPVASMLMGAITVGPEAIGRGLVPLIFIIAVNRSTRNRLFFKQEVTREELRKAWHLHANNPVARMGFLLGLLTVFVSPIGPLLTLLVLAPGVLACSIIGLRRVDPTAHPPVGRKGQAITGIVLGAVSLLVAVVSLLRTLATGS